MTTMPRSAPAARRGTGVGEIVRRPDGIPKVTGEFLYSSDLTAADMLWGATVRSPHPRARIRSIDTTDAAQLPGVAAVLTHADVRGLKLYGLKHPDQPVLAWDAIRYQGEPVAIVAADHPETARRAAERVRIDYDVQVPVTDPEAALLAGSPLVHPTGNITGHVKIRRGDEHPGADVVVTGHYEIGMQDQAFLGPESGLAIPAVDGGIDLHISTQWLHVDRDQVAACLGLPADKVRLTLAGVGGAFGAREDLSMQVHACMLALATGKPVKMMYSREESFFGHVHRHPAKMDYEHGATPDGKLVYVKARIMLDGGAYESSSSVVAMNAACFACGPYNIPSVVIDSYAMFTNNPPCGAMRGFGAVQTCFAYESQMDKLAEALGIDPVELRLRNAMTEGSQLPAGQRVIGPVPVAEVLAALTAMPAAPPSSAIGFDLRTLPGGVANTTHGEGVRRGVGYAVGIKNICYSAGYDDPSTARVILDLDSEGNPVVSVKSAAAEVGQGLVTVMVQIAQTELGIDRVMLLPADTSIESSGSTSASRQTYVTGGAAQMACVAVRERVLQRAAEHIGAPVDDCTLVEGNVVSASRGHLCAVADLLADGRIDETRTYRHLPTTPIDPETGQGEPTVQFAVAAHRATVDVDTELGLVRVVEIATAQDVGKVMNPVGLAGQIEGGIAQGLGLALMEEIQIVDGIVRNPSFTDYLIPTILDMPKIRAAILECADPNAPYGLRGAGEPPTISSPPAIIAAIRQATGRALTRIPLRPDDVVFPAK